MKRFLWCPILMLLIACDDGDLQIETLDFDSKAIQNCEGIMVDVANILFKLNETEALIVELPAGSIKNEVSAGVVTHNVSTSGPAKVSYRAFSDNVTNAYFCTDPPVTTPTVIEEIVAQGGSVLITTVLNDDGITYEHTIALSEISLVTAQDTRITDLSINNFGTVTTILAE